MRHPQGAIAKRITEVGEDAICTSIIIAAGLFYGGAKKGSERLTSQLDAILSLDAPIDEAYAAIRTHLERAGTPIGGNDLLIAAQARNLGLTVITANVGEFSRVPDLAIETWL